MELIIHAKRGKDNEMEITTEFPDNVIVTEVQQVLLAIHNALSDQLDRVAKKNVAEHKWLTKEQVHNELIKLTIKDIS